MTQPTQEYIESRLASVEPDVEVLLVEQVSPGKVRLFIDSTDGVDLALCERVTNHLRDLLVDYSLEDSLLSAYKKTPGAAKYARVDMDRNSGDFIVYELLIPADLEERLLSEVETEEPTVDPETGELREPPEPELDPEKLKEYEDQIEIEDVTPHDFGRIAAQTAKQVILQRIREAERDMMFEEYRDRVGELITGIVQQS